jgi:cytoskeleton protein RodZ
MTGDTSGTDGWAGAAAQVGARLRDAREAQRVPVSDCAAALRARADQLRALEAGRLDVFGGEVYARGFVRSYARLLGLDPSPLLAELGAGAAGRGVDHLRTLPAERRRIERRTPARLVALALVVGAGLVVTAALRLGDVRTPDAAPPPSAAPGDAAAPAAPAEPAPTPEPAPAVVEPVAPIDLVLTLEAPSWLEIVVDGVVVEPGRTAPAGETLRFEAQLAVVVRYGNAGGVRAELNGDDLGPQGASGQVVRVGYGPDGVLDRPPGSDTAG